MFTVDFFREDDGTKPVGQFIRELDVKMKAKVVSDLHRLEMLGNEAREPLSKHLEDDIFEMRSVFGNDIVRILYFFDENKLIIENGSRNPSLALLERIAEALNSTLRIEFVSRQTVAK